MFAWLEKLAFWKRTGREVSRKDVSHAAVVDEVFTTDDWRGEQKHSTPVEDVFRQKYERSLPDGKRVEKLLGSKHGLDGLLTEAGKGTTRMKLIVGLGNPGAKYAGTRHNMGYEVLAELGKRFGVGRPKMKFQGELLEAEIQGTKAILLSPTTYMNLSGQSVRPCLDFYKIAISDVLVICDDVNLPVGKLRIRAKGSSGGQKGLADVIRVLGGEGVARLRIGVGEKPAGWDLADFVLSKFSKADAELISVAVRRAADAAVEWAVRGLSSSMDKYNGQD